VHCREIEDIQLCRAFEAVEMARNDTPLTYFEFGTLAALWHFVETGVDAAVLEIGLGGRLDAVNAFEPSCAVITSIDLDHLDYLGNNRESIGFEKAGIYRSGIPALCGDPDPPRTLTQRAHEVVADYRQIGKDFGVEPYDQHWNFWTRGTRKENLPMPALAGRFQLGNAACALEALMAVHKQLPVSDQSIRKGLAHVELPGRFQVLPGSPCVILDVAHNTHAACGLAENLRQNKNQGRTLAVFAMLADKDSAGVVQATGGEVDSWFLAGIDQPRGSTAVRLEEIVRTNAPRSPVMVFDSVAEALAQACRSAGENDRIVAFGSFYTVADVLRALPTTEIGSEDHGC
jgi:dihydrofolate synthase/folylpolyglutamate synthase